VAGFTKIKTALFQNFGQKKAILPLKTFTPAAPEEALRAKILCYNSSIDLPPSNFK
jgi:hypothetical protein